MEHSVIVISDEEDGEIVWSDNLTVASKTRMQLKNITPETNGAREISSATRKRRKKSLSKSPKRVKTDISTISTAKFEAKKVCKVLPNLVSSVKHQENTVETGAKPQLSNSDDVKPDVKRATKRKSDSVSQPLEPTNKKAKPLASTSKETTNEDYEDDVIFVEEIVAAQVGADVNLCRKVIDLFKEDNTIPFIARYRKEVTSNMEIAKLREVHEVYENYKITQHRANVVLNKIESQGALTADIKKAIKSAVTVEEVEFVYAPFKVTRKSHATKAKELGLEPLARRLLDARCDTPLKVESYLIVNGDRITLKKLEEGVQHILADIISKDTAVLDCVRTACKNLPAKLTSTRKSTKPKNGEVGNVDQAKQDIQIDKFKSYFDYSCPVSTIQSHQVMALNRGENLNILKIKVSLQPNIRAAYNYFCVSHFQKYPLNHLSALDNDFRMRMLTASIDDAYNRLVEPIMCRQIRADLTKKAERVSLNVFAKNIRQVLLTPPLRGKVIMAIDPGFRNGCKIAVVAPNGDLLVTDVIHPHGLDRNIVQRSKEVLRNYLIKFRCETIGIGNGTACRETEAFVAEIIQSGGLAPLDVKYCIVDEQGVSIYSVSQLAAAEMPDLDPNVRSAVALARRILDPLSEYVKVDPKHIGVGMYQHDVSEPKLKQTLESVITECVSFVGVDINTCNEITLSKVAGLTACKAKKIIEWRTQNGCIINREQLKLVPGIGAKTFVQCAGFIRVLQETMSNTANKLHVTGKPVSKKKAFANVSAIPNPLDQTCIHPESYDAAIKFIVAMNGKLGDVGQPRLINSVQTFCKATSVESIALNLGVGVQTAQLITEGLTQAINFDIRDEFEMPIFRKGITSIEDLKIGTHVTGKVMNVVDFGMFVDIGVGKDGLLHKSSVRKVCNFDEVKRGSVVEVRIANIDAKYGRISLELIRVRN